MQKNDLLREWIADALKRRKYQGKTQRGLGHELNIGETDVSKIIKGRREVKAAELPLIERYLGERAPVHAEAETHVEPDDAAPGYVPIAVYDLRASAGAGAVAIDADAIGHVMFAQDFIAKAATKPSNLFVLEISGDSAMPTLYDGDHALVDRGQVDPRRSGLYVIRVDDVLQVKRISMHPTKKSLSLISENPIYRSYDNISPKDVVFVGRVIWIGRRLA
ncbi:MAG TPA: S24 family peptidase [Rhizomicrobium sp.]|jgi:phage repressor protein C with HTH and peptisase S24 domain